jgi:YegS/Rv2252/BmrU family lipid kinase
LFPKTLVRFTSAPGEATRLAREVAADFDTVVAVGGDGTIHEVINGLFHEGGLINPEIALGIVSLGTGADFVKGLSFPESEEDMLRLIVERRVRRIDVGRLQCVNQAGEPQHRYFINIADAGFGGELVEIVNGTTKALGPFVAFLGGLLRTLRRYQNKLVHIRIDDDFESEQVVNAVVVANGQFFGGGMWVAPQAALDDGLFDVVIIGDVTRREVLANIHKLYNGTLETHPKVTCRRGRRVELTSPERVLIDADGERPGELPASFEIVPAALQLIV